MAHSVEAGDPSLRLKNGYAQDDSTLGWNVTALLAMQQDAPLLSDLVPGNHLHLAGLNVPQAPSDFFLPRRFSTLVDGRIQTVNQTRGKFGTFFVWQAKGLLSNSLASMNSDYSARFHWRSWNPTLCKECKGWCTWHSADVIQNRIVLDSSLVTL